MRIGSALAAGILLIAVAPVVAAARIEKELELGPGGRFVLDTDNGELVVTGTGRSGARIVITSRAEHLEELYDIEFSARPGRVEVKVDKKRKGPASWFRWRKRNRLHFEIEVPRETDIDIDTSGGTIRVASVHGRARLGTSGGNIRALEIGGELDAHTSGGNIIVKHVDGSVDAHTSGGSIEVEDVRGDLRADTSGGNIEARQVTGDVSADTSGGTIRISYVGGRVDADTSGGSVRVSFSSGNYSGGRLSTSGGGIRVRLDPAADLFIDASASGGSVTVDIPITIQGKISKNKLKGRIGSGGETLMLRTSGGGVRIEPL